MTEQTRNPQEVATERQAGTAGGAPDATVVLTTKNRKQDLERAIASVLDQTGAMVETLVIDDGSRDGTAEMILERFPAVRLFRSETARGLVVQRNFAATVAKAPVIFSLDDDACFSSPETIATTLREFDSPTVGVVGIPVIDHPDGTVKQMSPEPQGRYFTFPFLGRAHAVHRELFLKLEGYRDFYFQQVEETDLSIRLYGAGYGIRMGSAAPIDHYPSPVRSRRRMTFFDARNNLLFAALNLDWRSAPVFAIRRSANLLLAALKHRCFWVAIRGLAAGLRDSWRFRDVRAPVSRSTYRLTRSLAHGPLQLSATELPSKLGAFDR